VTVGAGAVAPILDPAAGVGADPPADAMSERILDGALAAAAAVGMRRLTVDEVARRARVGRMTVYRHFGDRQRLVEALAARESGRCLAALDAAIDRAAPIADQVAAGLVTSIRLAREHPLLNRLASVEPEAVLEALNADGGAIFAAAREFVASRLRAAKAEGSLGDVDIVAAAELLVRIAVSFVLVQPSGLPLGDPEALGEVGRRLIAPMLGA
jgi:AcrR family transcriptional regulator